MPETPLRRRGAKIATPMMTTSGGVLGSVPCPLISWLNPGPIIQNAQLTRQPANTAIRRTRRWANAATPSSASTPMKQMTTAGLTC